MIVPFDTCIARHAGGEFQNFSQSHVLELGDALFAASAQATATATQ